MSSLLKSFKYFKQTLLVGRIFIALDDLLKALRDNERMTNDVSQSGETVLAVKSAERGRSRASDYPKGRSKSRPNKKDMSTVECYYCGETGYMKMFSPNLKEDLSSFKEIKGTNEVDDAYSIHAIEDGEFLMAT